jgi:hypothetical protein
MENKNKRRKISFFSKIEFIRKYKIVKNKMVKKDWEMFNGKPKKLSVFDFEKKVESPKIKTRAIITKWRG